MDARVSCIFQDKAGNLWIGSDIKFGTEKGGLYRYTGKAFTLFSQIYDLSMYSVWTAVEDEMAMYGLEEGEENCFFMVEKSLLIFPAGFNKMESIFFINPSKSGSGIPCGTNGTWPGSKGRLLLCCC